ncbi:hypothetical protein VSR17_20865 [Cupriavidus taiwanensis]|uniref:hypothetical protein n=1 Tax=Cupriavidus taiwanensis TaxID=164546 RepID=UPI0018DE7BA0|nr:hypothetical protein [Cupriavidus taiwanensis]
MSRANVPDWLAPLYEARQRGQIPARRWLILSLGVRLATWVPWIAVPLSYRPGVGDDMRAICGIDVEIAIDDETPAFTVCGLASRILAANPRRLLVQTFGRKPVVVLLKKGSEYGLLDRT